MDHSKTEPEAIHTALEYFWMWLDLEEPCVDGF